MLSESGVAHAAEREAHLHYKALADRLNEGT